MTERPESANQDFEALHVYDWVLAKNAKERVQKLTRKLLSTARSSGKRVAEASSSSSSVMPAKKTKKGVEPKSGSDVMDLFGK